MTMTKGRSDAAAGARETRPGEQARHSHVPHDGTPEAAAIEAAQLAAKQGRELLAKLKAGETVQAGWTPAKLVSRKETQGFAAPEIAEIFKVDPAKLPGYTGVESARGAFVLLKVSRTIDAEETDAARRKAA